jgi:single-strand DNA-binding protein
MNVNIVILAGHLTRAPELRVTQGGLSVCKFGLAVSDRWTDDQGEKHEKAHFFDCTAFGKRGEAINKHFVKGAPIYLECRAQFEQWEEKNTKEKRSKVTFLVDSFQFVETTAAREAREAKRGEEGTESSNQTAAAPSKGVGRGTPRQADAFAGSRTRGVEETPSDRY